MDMATIGAAVASLKAAGDMAAAMIGIKNTADVQAKAIELNQKLIEAQHQIFAVNSEHANLIEQIRSLESDLDRLNSWNESKKKYKLTNPWEGPAQVYGVKKSCQDEEPHWVCTKCYDDNRRSILQPKKINTGKLVMVCPTCKAELATGYREIGPAEYVAD